MPHVSSLEAKERAVSRMLAKPANLRLRSGCACGSAHEAQIRLHLKRS